MINQISAIDLWLLVSSGLWVKLQKPLSNYSYNETPHFFLCVFFLSDPPILQNASHSNSTSTQQFVVKAVEKQKSSTDQW